MEEVNTFKVVEGSSGGYELAQAKGYDKRIFYLLKQISVKVGKGIAMDDSKYLGRKKMVGIKKKT